MSTPLAQSIAGRVRGYIVENFLYMRRDLEFADDAPLFGNGIIDSLGVMELIAFTEQELGVPVDDADITERNFGSVASITRFVIAKRGAASPAGAAALSTPVGGD